ncbi:Histidine kinase-, DNA gyrase B-, and HSP90-like ATPase [Nitrosospira briensis]|uniref:histidine kinase n=1 Tax=Nitrosospira briensis TaxID=35799 RepID=A0A1I4XZL0_9PROT|nr:ATP-binding protein [Nitrosospira briensis]SFN31264.1 Histidine kinase-, DNA gyrase B-, and HSP90-like ATPase [Nitrosospira briensis]
MRINVFTNFFLVIILLGLGLLIALSSQALGTLDDVINAERQKHHSLQLANELFRSSENLTKMARGYVITGNSNYEQFFFEILGIRNGTLPRPAKYLNNYWEVNWFPVQAESDNPISLMELMRREGFSERELDLLRQSQNISDNLVNLEKQAFAAVRGLYDDGYGNFTVAGAPDRDFAIDLLFGQRYIAEKTRIMLPISEFTQMLDIRTQTTLSTLQGKFQQQMLLILALLCIGLLIVVCAAFLVRRNVLRPLDHLRRQASSIARGSYSTRCDISTHNEIAKVGADFNTMAEAIEHEITKLKQVEGSLRERLKEIRCFYGIRRGMESGSLEEVCKTIFVQLIAAMQFPNITTIKIELDGKQFVSGQYDKDHIRVLRKQILVYGEACGSIAIFYSEDRPFLLPEEQNLIDVVGDDLGKWLERKHAEAMILTEQELRVRDAATREFAAHVERMREEDRKYIAREIHDELGQLLAALHLEISLLKSGQVNRSEKLEIIRHNMLELVDQAGQSVRNVAEHLRPASLEFGIISAIRKLTNEFSKHSGLNCTLQLMEAPIDLDENQTVTIFRIVQESLTNVTRHAEASCVKITLWQNADDFMVEVRDNGKGFDPASAPKKKSFGLLGMRERAAVLGGSIDISSVPQQGTVVSMCIPMKQNKENGLSAHK